MDVKGNPNATVPIMEFMVPMSEMAMSLKEGERGKLLVPVEVVAINDGMVTFRKMNSITAEGTFRRETANEMRTRLLQDEKIKEEKE
jgi:hypothetical protein